jgi:hypothetical protein
VTGNVSTLEGKGGRVVANLGLCDYVYEIPQLVDHHLAHLFLLRCLPLPSIQHGRRLSDFNTSRALIEVSQDLLAPNQIPHHHDPLHFFGSFLNHLIGGHLL